MDRVVFPEVDTDYRIGLKVFKEIQDEAGRINSGVYPNKRDWTGLPLEYQKQIVLRLNPFQYNKFSKYIRS